MLFLITFFYFMIIAYTNSTKRQSDHSFILPTNHYIRCDSIPSTDAFIRTYKPYTLLGTKPDLKRVEPTIQRIRSLLEKIRLKEDEYQSLLDTFDVFNMKNPELSFKPYGYGSDIDDIKMLYNRYIKLLKNNKTIEIDETFIDYLRSISSYLSDGFRNQRTNIVNYKFLHFHFFFF